MKPGDLVKAVGPAAPAIGLVLEMLPSNRVSLIWIDNNEVDACSASLVKVISISE